MNFNTNSCYREKEKNLAVETLLGGHSILLVGKAGIGISALLKFICIELETKGARLLKVAPGSIKQILVSLAVQLYLYEEDDKFPTSPRLQREVSETLKYERSIIVIDEANRLSIAVRSWLEELHENGQLFLLGAKPALARDIFLKLPRMELKPLDYEFIRKIISETAEELQIELTPADVATLQERCGGNPMLARRVVREHQIGLKAEQSRPHRMDQRHAVSNRRVDLSDCNPIHRSRHRRHESLYFRRNARGRCVFGSIVYVQSAERLEEIGRINFDRKESFSVQHFGGEFDARHSRSVCFIDCRRDVAAA